MMNNAVERICNALQRDNTTNPSHRPVPRGIASRLCLCIGAAAIAMSLCVSAYANDEAESLAPWPSDKRVRAMMADQLIILANAAMSGEQRPTQDQLLMADLLFDPAKQLTPNDAELWWKVIQLENALDRRSGYRQALGRYIQLRPGDDRVVWMRIEDELAQQQTMEERLALVNELLASSPRQRIMTPPIQSRLLTILATAAHEAGDTEKVKQYLQHALRLDVTNAQAAAMQWQRVFDDPEATPIQQFEGLLGLVRANPSNSGIRILLANLLFQEGLYRQSRQQINMAAQLSQDDLPLQLLPTWALAMLADGQNRDALKLLMEIEEGLTMLMREQQAQQQPEIDMPADAELPVLLPVDLVVLKMVVAEANPTADAAIDAWNDVRTVFEVDTAIEEPSRELAWIAGMYCPDFTEAEALLEARPEDEVTAIRGRGWLAMRMGDFEGARKLLQPLAAEDDFALLALAQMSPNPQAREAVLNRITRNNPGNLIGVLASRELARRNDVGLPTDLGREMLESIEQMPRRIWDTDMQYFPWVIAQADMNEGRYRYLEPMVCRIRLNNNSRTPIPIGRDRALPSRGMLIAQASSGHQQMMRFPPIIFEADRRFRLESDETLDLIVRLDRSLIGLTLSNTPQQSMTMRLNAITDPQILPNMSIQPGPLGASRRLRAFFRIGQSADVDNLQQWLDVLLAIDPANVTAQDATVVARVCLMMLVELDTRVASDDAQERLRLQKECLDAVVALYEKSPDWLRAWIVRFIPPTMEDSDREASPLMQLVREARQDHSAFVRQMVLATHVWHSNAPYLQVAMEDSDENVAAFARAKQAVLVKIEAGEIQEETVFESDADAD